MVIGVTGGIASGKSLVAAELARFGGCVIDADRLARELVEPGKPALEAVIREFGGRFLRPDGTLDRRALGRLVFSDPRALERLNAIMFPRMTRLLKKRIREALARCDAGVVVVDAAVLFEAGWDRLVDRAVVVVADEATRVERMVARDAIPREDALARVRAQGDWSDKARKADFVIDNSGSLEALKRQIDSVARELGIAMMPRRRRGSPEPE